MRNVGRDAMYTRFCGVPEQTPNVCPSVGWLKDFIDAQSMLDPVFNGENDPPVEQRQLAVARRAGDQRGDRRRPQLVDDPAERAQAWGDIDTMITEQAAAVPYVWDNQVNIQSTDVVGVINLFNANWDLSFTSLEG